MKFIPTVATALFVVFGMRHPSNAQVPGTHAPSIGTSSSIVLTNPSPQPRAIGANYFGDWNQSQVWMNVAPELPKPDPIPVILNLTVAFPGLQLSQAPAAVQVRAESIC